MHKVTRILLCLLIWAPVSTQVLLGAEGEARENGPAITVIYSVLPLLIVGGLLWWFLRMYNRSPFVARAREYYERSEQHMQRMEQIGERIAAALERGDKDAA